MAHKFITMNCTFAAPAAPSRGRSVPVPRHTKVLIIMRYVTIIIKSTIIVQKVYEINNSLISHCYFTMNGTFAAERAPRLRRCRGAQRCSNETMRPSR